jgi:acylphosphatase
MTERRSYRITGLVQGVGFRWWARDAASGLGLRGRVRNAPDGTVRLDAEGPPEALDRLERLLRRGPAAARVDDVLPDPPSDSPLPTGFEISR